MRFWILIFYVISPFLLIGQSLEKIISGGFSHTLYLCENGNVFSWGDNTYGQLGRDSLLSEDINPEIIPTLSNIIAIDAGKGNFSMALKSDSSLWTWGDNSQFQLGTNNFCSTSNNCDVSFVPVQVEGGETGTGFLTNVVQISAGMTQAYALLNSGKIVAWGDNTFGQLGNGSEKNQVFPVYVTINQSTPLSNVIYITAGALYCFAITSDGKAWGWGKNTNLELGCGNNLNQLYAVPIVDSTGTQLTNIKAISAGYRHALFLTTTGNIYGTGAFLGTATKENATEYQIENYATLMYNIDSISSISSGFTHNIVLRKTYHDSIAYSWGDNKYFSLSKTAIGGQLGVCNDTLLQSLSPRPVINSIDDTIASVQWVAATNGDSYIFTKDKITRATTLLGTGANDAGQLGTLDHTDRYCATKIIIPQCVKNCPTVFIGDNKYLCTPIKDTLLLNYQGNNYVFQWFRNDTLLNNATSNELDYTLPATYSVEVSDSSKGCTSIADEITIKARKPDFTIFYPNYCGDSISFNIFSKQAGNWYTEDFLGKYLGTGTSITVPTNQLSNYKNDSTKVIWLFTNQCQALPVIATKYCKPCSLPSPTIHSNMTHCENFADTLIANGENIKWFDLTKNAILSLSDTLIFNYTRTGLFEISATQSDSVCESQADTLMYSVEFCIITYSISGTCLPNQRAQIFILDATNPSDTIAQTITDINGNYSITIPEGTIIIYAIPDSTQYYQPTYFGNTSSFKSAYMLDVNANIGNADITFNTLTGLQNNDNTIEIFPKILTNNNLLTIKSNQTITAISLVNMLGEQIYYKFHPELTTEIDCSLFASGSYIVKLSLADNLYTTIIIKQ